MDVLTKAELNTFKTSGFQYDILISHKHHIHTMGIHIILSLYWEFLPIKLSHHRSNWFVWLLFGDRWIIVYEDVFWPGSPLCHFLTTISVIALYLIDILRNERPLLGWAIVAPQDYFKHLYTFRKYSNIIICI